MRRSFFLSVLWLLVALLTTPVLADAPQVTDKAKAEIEAAVTAANAATHHGPEKIALAGQAVLNLPQGYDFTPAAESLRLLRALGNQPGDDLLGMVTPAGENEEWWFMVVRYIGAGYVKDEDGKDWKADDLLKSIREGVDETNAARRERGIPEMEVVGWVEAPQYDAGTHRLVWSLASKAKGGGDEQGVNYNTLMLGREGYVSMNMVADRTLIDGLKPTAHELLGALEFNAGKRYADFNSSTDKVAEYGLAALVAGVAAKKLGMFAVIAAFVAKFAKVIGIAALAGVAGLGKLFGRKKDESGKA